jgi:hypothetical protein
MAKSLTRRILAILIVVCTVSVLTYLSIWQKSNEAMVALTVAMSLVTGYYFGVTNKA